jgi:hypothetical protein
MQRWSSQGRRDESWHDIGQVKSVVTQGPPTVPALQSRASSTAAIHGSRDIRHHWQPWLPERSNTVDALDLLNRLASLEDMVVGLKCMITSSDGQVGRCC